MRQVGLQLARGGKKQILGRKVQYWKVWICHLETIRDDDDDHDDDDVEDDNDDDGHGDAMMMMMMGFYTLKLGGVFETCVVITSTCGNFRSWLLCCKGIKIC